MSVQWTQYGKDGKPTSFKNMACFIAIQQGPLPVRVVYPATINSDLKPDGVKFWVDFLATWLPAKYFFTIGDEEVEWDLDCKGMGWPEMLLYLTAFRYIDEFSATVNQLASETKGMKDPDEIFQHFQRMDMETGWMGGHRLCSQYSGSGPNAVTIAKFQANIGHADSVGRHFSSKLTS